MTLVVLKPEDYPMLVGQENWFLIHPNNIDCEFCVPVGAAAVCKQPLLGIFHKNLPYPLVNYDKDHAWITVQLSPEVFYKMPLYVFARHFDAEAFVRRVRD